MGATGSLRALLAGLIDYAGLYPPAELSLPEVAERYDSYQRSPDAWMLNRLVLPVGKLGEVTLGEDWKVTLLVDGEPGTLPRQVETLETKRPEGFTLTTYCEAPLSQIAGGFAKVRTGGLTPDAIPTVDAIAEFLHDAAELRLPFKATAGLHHPLRSLRPLTYAADSPRATMHGFLNVFAAAIFAWYGAEAAVLQDVLSEEAASAFAFGEEELRWRSQTVPTRKIESARRFFAHSFGSCSFEEPVAELRELGLLP